MELTLSLPHGDERLAMTGLAERNLKILRESLGVNIAARNGSLRLSGRSSAVGQAAQVLERLAEAARQGRPMARQELLEAISNVGQAARPAAPAPPSEEPRMPASRRPAGDTLHRWNRDQGVPAARSARRLAAPALGPGLDVYARNRPVKAVTAGQERYLDAIHQHDLTFCIGPAGTGKTYLAVAAATAMLREGRVRKLVLVRPAVEAGEKLGFLPGDLQAKVNPYLRPLLDALHDMMDYEQIQRFMATDVIEIVPLAFMRGRTLNEACVILDEAQNTTRLQMLMFLTRMGQGSKMIVTGDTSQIDLEDPLESGLVDAARRLMRVPGIAFVTLEQTDIVRHSLVQRIVEAYEPSRKPRRRRASTPATPPAAPEAAAPSP